jgi:hypothetical protein
MLTEAEFLHDYPLLAYIDHVVMAAFVMHLYALVLVSVPWQFCLNISSL